MYWDSAAQRTGCTKKRIRVEYVPIGQERGGQLEVGFRASIPVTWT
jgi:hypothetical protein